MKPPSPANNVSVAPDVIGKLNGPLVLFSNGEPTSAATPSGALPACVLRTNPPPCKVIIGNGPCNVVADGQAHREDGI